MKQKKMKTVSLLLSLCMALSILPAFSLPVQAAEPQPLLIAAVYGGNLDEAGEATDKAAVSHSFIEIYNPGTEAVSLSGYALHYQGYPSNEAYIGNRGDAENWAKLVLDSAAEIPAKGSYLIHCGETGSSKASLTLTDEDFDQKWSDNLPGFVSKGAKYVLTYGDVTIPAGTVNPFDTDKSGTTIDGYVDMFGGAGNDDNETDEIDGYETAFLGGKKEGSSKKKGFVRKDRNVDTDNNAEDFMVVDFSDDLDTVTTPRSLADGPYNNDDETHEINVTSVIEAETPSIITVSFDQAVPALEESDFGVSVGEELVAGWTFAKTDEQNYEITLTSPAVYGETYTLTITKEGYRFVGDAVTNNVLDPSAKVITQAMIGSISDQTFTGAPIEPEVTVTEGDTPLVKDADYTLSYSSNTNVGSATVTVEGKGEYSGSAEKNFAIQSALPDTFGNMLTYLGSYSTGKTSEDGGVAEIVKYNAENKKMYVVSGAFQSVDIVPLAKVKAGTEHSYAYDTRVEVQAMGEVQGFSAGDITSVDVNTKLDIVAISVQHKEYNENGNIVFLDYDGNYIAHYEAGNQPDMIGFSPDGNYVMTANEGEPRTGYGESSTDPQGSVTIVDLSGVSNHAGLKALSDEITTVGFEDFDGDARAQLLTDKVLLKPNTAPSVDLEPEYIAFSEDSKTAYVSLQEANAIATFDIADKSFTAIKGLGLKDHNDENNKLDLIKDKTINIKNEAYEGVYMPDGLAAANIGGTQYVLTPNEGDSREWGDYNDIKEVGDIEGLNGSERESLTDDTTYLLGGRSFSIWNAASMTQVYDSGADFERITAEVFPDMFNSSHKEVKLDNRSGKKGPEPEDIKTLKINDKYYAFIGLERIGGLMMYDITNPAEAAFVDYYNNRVEGGTLTDSGDLGAEGICTISAKQSPTGYPMVLVANEVSGTVTVLQVNEGKMKPPSSGGSGGTGTSGGTKEVDETTVPSKEDTSIKGDTVTTTTKINAKADASGTAVATVEASVLANLIDSAKKAEEDEKNAVIEIKVTLPNDAKDVQLVLPKSSVDAIAKETLADVTLNTGLAILRFDSKAIEAVSAADTTEDVQVSVKAVEIASLPADVQAKIGERPVYDFSVTAGNKEISDFQGGSAQIGIPYTLADGEDPNAVVLYYLTDSGKLEIVVNGYYDTKSGMTLFTTQHFSSYAVGYNKVAFQDVSAEDWYYDAVSFIAARGIAQGIDGNNFGPDLSLTRGQFITLLLRAYDIAPEENAEDNFSDAGDSYYTGYLAAAKQLGISNGIGNNSFAPQQEITRQEMFTMLYNTLNVLGQLPPGESGKTIDDFTDSDEIDPWAKNAMNTLVKTGVVSGSAGKLSPTDTSVRAEMVQVLYSLIAQ